MEEREIHAFPHGHLCKVKCTQPYLRFELCLLSSFSNTITVMPHVSIHRYIINICNSMSICPGLFYAYRLGNCIHCTSASLVQLFFVFFKRVLFNSHTMSSIPNTNNLHIIVYFQVFWSNNMVWVVGFMV